VHADTLDVEQLLTAMVNGPDVVFDPCLPNVNTGGCTQLALLPVCPLFGHRIAVLLPPPPTELMPMLRFAVLVSAGELESVIFTVNDDVPAVIGVPIICPALLNVSPTGNAPEDIDQLYGAVPPLAESVAKYAVPTCPPTKDEVVIWTGVAPAVAIAMLKLFVVLCAGELASVTLTVNEAVPAAVGVPLICPALLSVSPTGNAPEDIDQLYGAVPPLAESAAAYAVPTCPPTKDEVVI
jgi:hypothetical protein